LLYFFPSHVVSKSVLQNAKSNPGLPAENRAAGHFAIFKGRCRRLDKFLFCGHDGGMKRIAVYCGSNKGVRPEYAAAAQALGTLLAREKIELVYGGGMVGLMGIVADAVLENGGHVIGVIPQKLVIKEVVHEKLPDLRVVKDMHERKAMMAGLADGFIALPGGYGTFEEFFEVLAWSQLGWHPKPFGLLNIAGFYRPLLEFLDHTRDEGFIRPEHRHLVLVADGAAGILQQMRQYRPPREVKWKD
jgi:uncharacterized protein (TIGR00730 family)